jgi:putative DNA primase/helicase
MTDDNIVRLARLQENGELPATAEDSMALVFADRHAAELRYVAMWGHWLVFDGTIWRLDSTLHVFDRARAICREVAADCDKPVGAVASAKTVAAVERLAKADRRLAAVIEQWDADAWAITTADKTLDLRTGIGRAPDPLDYITKQTTCGCAPPGTPHPLWTKFLYRVTNNNTGLITFLQRWCGYCLTGSTREHVFVFAHGTGANGKSTFVNTVRNILDQYATVADMGTFLASNSERHPTDLAKLRGARLVVAIETQKGRRWDETKIKAMTGGDPITARFMRQDFFDFTPNFKLFICGNHKPRLSSVDAAICRRLLLVPFTVEIPPIERDKDLADKLKAEWPAILRWMLDGCLKWQGTGLAPPKIVLDATENYFTEQDIMRQWLDECTEKPNDLVKTPIAELFTSWGDWCERRKLKPGTEMAFSMALSDKGFEKTKDPVTRRMVFRAIGLRKA